MIGAVVAMDDEAEALLSQMEVEDIRTIYGKTVHIGRAFGKECLLVYAKHTPWCQNKRNNVYSLEKCAN